MSDDDVWESPSSKRWVQTVLADMAPKMRDSGVAVSMVPGDGSEGDVKYWVELGAMIMYDKPIIVVAFSDRELPERLRRVADEIVICPDGVNEEASEMVAAAIKRQMEKLGPE